MTPSRHERENVPNPSTMGMPFAVGFYFAFRIAIVLLSVRILGTSPQSGAAINLGLNFFFLTLTAFFALGNARIPSASMMRLPDVRWAFAFLGFSCCSLLWTSAASLSAAVAYWCAMAADVAITVMLLRAGPLRAAAESLMKGYVWGACTFAIITWLLPAQSDLRLGDEELLGPNQIGYLCAFAFFFAQYLMRQRRGEWGIAALVLGVTLLRSLSKTSIVAFLISQSFLLIRDRSMSRRTRVSLALGAAIVIAAFWGLLAVYFDIYASAGGQPETLTGRLGIWAYMLAEAIQQPWVGHGFHSVWKVIPPFGPDQFEARHAHNELLQQFYAYGAAGVLLFVGIYTSLFRHFRRIASAPMKTFLLAFLLFVLVRGLADTEPFDLSLPLWSILLLSLLAEHESDANALPVPGAERIQLKELRAPGAGMEPAGTPFGA